MAELSISDILDDEDVVAEIILMRAADPQKAFLIVEGETDRKLFSSFIDERACDIIVANGKDNALAAIKHIRHQKIIGVLCIVDSDYDTFLNICHSAPDVIVTDEHDIECMLVESTALHRIINELGSKQKIKRNIRDVDHLKQILYSAAYEIGVIRFCSLKFGENLRFEGLKFRSLNQSNITIDPQKILTEVLGHSSKQHLPKKPMQEKITLLKQSSLDFRLLCCGHDLTTLLGRALQSMIGSQPALKTTCEEIESRLRLGFSWIDLQKTKLFIAIKCWEQKNSKFLIFKNSMP